MHAQSRARGDLSFSDATLSRDLSEAPASLPSREVAFAVLQAAYGVSALALSIWPPNDVSPRRLDAVLGVLTLVLAGITMATRNRVSWWASFSLILAATGINVIVATRVTVQGVAVMGALLGLLSVVTALYLPRRQLIVFVTYYLVGFLVAMQFTEVESLWVFVAVTVAINIIVASAIYRLVSALRDKTRQLEEQATRDPLTGLFNRRGADVEAAAVRAVAQRSANAPTTVAVLDLDGFKRTNDEQGHEAGDRVLQQLAIQWKRTIRSGDVLARVGGDEFILVMPDTAAESAEVLLDRMRRSSCHSWSHGIAEWSGEESLTKALRRADESMYDAKSMKPSA